MSASKASGLPATSSPSSSRTVSKIFQKCLTLSESPLRGPSPFQGARRKRDTWPNNWLSAEEEQSRAAHTQMMHSPACGGAGRQTPTQSPRGALQAPNPHLMQAPLLGERPNRGVLLLFVWFAEHGLVFGAERGCGSPGGQEHQHPTATLRQLSLQEILHISGCKQAPVLGTSTLYAVRGRNPIEPPSAGAGTQRLVTFKRSLKKQTPQILSFKIKEHNYAIRHFFFFPFPTQLRNLQPKLCFTKRSFVCVALPSSAASFAVITEMCCRHYTLYN